MKFAPGDRVAARPATSWDNDLDDFTESEAAYMRLHGHYGRVVADCGRSCGHNFIHVCWEGTYDGRPSGPTRWTDGYAWHMDDDEIEHVD